MALPAKRRLATPRGHLAHLALLLLVYLWAGPGAAADGAPAGLETLVAGAFSPDRPGGVVMVRRDGRTLLHQAYGMADLELQVPMQTSNLLATGSVAKQFTAAAILRLVQEGRLRLDDDVRQYLPGVSPGDVAMTIEQLLTHTAGFPSAVDREDFEAISRQSMSVGELLALTHGMDMHFEPGAAYRYSDSGYFLLGAVIEAVSGMSYGAYMEGQVFRPAGLVHTLYGDEARIIEGRVAGYTRDDSGVVNAHYINMTIPYSAGGIYATVEDLADWIDVLRGGEFIRPDLVERAWTDRSLPDGTRVSYGFGWNLCEIAGARSIGHGGFINGFTANLEYLPDAGITIAVMTNQDYGDPEATYLVRRVARYLLTGTPELQPVKLSEWQLSAITGTYLYPEGDRRRIFVADGMLFSQRNDAEAIALVPVSENYFAFPDTEGTYGLEFHTGDSDGAARVITRLNCSPMAMGDRE